MSAVSVTCRRTLSQSRVRYLTALAFGAFLSVVGVLFAFALEGAEGGRLSLAAVWASAVSPVLPFLAALIGMDVWSGEFTSGRIDLMLASPVRERDFVIGKFLGTWIYLLVAIAFSLLSISFALRHFAPALVSGLSLMSLVPAVAVLAMQGALWSAVAVAASSLTRRSAVAALETVAVTSLLPRIAWRALKLWSPASDGLGAMPIDAHAIDFASGMVSSGTIVAYLALTVIALLLSSKSIALRRLIGREARMRRVGVHAAMVLAMVLAGLVISLSARLDVSFDLPVGGGMAFSERTRGILSDAHGVLSITCSMSRSDPRFREAGLLLRAFKRESEKLGGLRIDLQFTDPNWDIAQASRLVALGVSEQGVVLERGGRHVVVPFPDAFGERELASAILSLTAPPQRRVVQWTVGHGEAEFDDYGPYGMSNIARELAREGYSNRTLDLGGGEQIPADSALVVVAGAKEGFSRSELARIDDYLRRGGRLLSLSGVGREGGVAAMLPQWGAREEASVGTVAGRDTFSVGFLEHAITGPLFGSRIMLSQPASFIPSAAAQQGEGTDKIAFTALAKIGEKNVVIALERGCGAGDDVGIRPTRIVAVGDASFAANQPLGSRANANRDFFLNAVAYLSGTDALTATGGELGCLVSGMDRRSHLKFAFVIAGAVPAALWLVLAAMVWVRRRK